MKSHIPVLSNTPPEEYRRQVESLTFDSVIHHWLLNRSKFINATLEGFILGNKVDINPDELERPETLNKSFRLTNVQLYSPEVKSFCDNFYNKTNFVLTANLYFTPHNEAQCFVWHSDSQYSMVYQMEGEKQWSFLKNGENFIKETHEQEVVLNNYNSGKLEAQIINYDLKKRYWLEFPYSLLHKAENLGLAPSVHITFAYNHPSWGDFGKFLFEKIMNTRLKDQYKRPVSMDELILNLSKQDLDTFEILQEFKEHFQIIENIKKSEGRPYGYDS